MDELLKPTNEWRKTADRMKRREMEKSGVVNVGMSPISDEKWTPVSRLVTASNEQLYFYFLFIIKSSLHSNKSSDKVNAIILR